MTNFRFLSRVQPALIQRQCKREERKESEHDELSFSFPSAACTYPKNQQLVIVLPEGSEELPIRIVRGSRSRGEAPCSSKRKVTRERTASSPTTMPHCRNIAPTPHVGGSLRHPSVSHEAITQPRPTSASWTRSGHRSYPTTVHLTTPGTAQSGPAAIRHGCRLMKKPTSGGSLVSANM